MSQLDVETLDAFIQRNPTKRVNAILGALNRSTGFMKALESPLGVELLDEVGGQLESLMKKIVDEEASEKDRADFRAYKRIGRSWGEKIRKHYELIQRVKGDKHVRDNQNLR